MTLPASHPFDTVALRRGGSVALVVAVPLGIASRLVADRPGASPWTAALWLLALAGFTLGAGVAAWTQTRALPFLHGMVCAAATYSAAQAVFVVLRLVRGDRIRWLAIFFTFSAVLVAGVVGGALGSVLRRRGLVPSTERRANGPTGGTH